MTYVVPAAGNNAPVFSSNPVNQTATVGTAFSYTIPVATDADGDTLTYTAANLPAGLSFNPTTREISGTPTTVENKIVTIGVDDGNGGTDTKTFGITVNAAANSAPVLGAMPGAQSLTEGTAMTPLTLPAATDADGDTITYSLTGLPSGSGLSFDPATRTLSGTPNATDQAAQPITLTYTADDGNGGTDTDTLVLNISAAANNAPVINASSSTKAGDHDGGTYAASALWTYGVSDADGDTLTYAWSVVSKPAGAADPTFSSDTAANPNITYDKIGGDYVVRLTVSDGNGGSDTQDFTYTVPNAAPTATIDSLTASGLDTTLKYTLNDTDGDLQQNVVIDWGDGNTEGPTNNHVVGSQVTKTHTYAAAGTYTVGITGNDGHGGTFTQTQNITVSASNNAPVNAALTNQTATHGQAFSYTIPAASDADGDTLTYSVSGLPTGTGLAFNAATRELSGTPNNVDRAASPITVSVTVSDGTDSDTDTFTLTVDPSGMEVSNFADGDTISLSGGPITFEYDQNNIVDAPGNGADKTAVDGVGIKFGDAAQNSTYFVIPVVGDATDQGGWAYKTDYPNFQWDPATQNNGPAINVGDTIWVTMVWHEGFKWTSTQSIQLTVVA